MSTTPQDPFFEDQDISSINIDELYANILQEIDLIRSHFDASSIDFSKIKNIDDLSSQIHNSDIYSNNFQESRCHAFYRMIGFPVVSENKNFYSPGFDQNLNRNSDQFLKNIEIASSISKDIKKAMKEREDYSKNTFNVFSIQTQQSTAVAMASVFVRSFGQQLKNTDPFSTNSIQDQVFAVPDRSVISDFFDSPSILNYGNENFKNSKHILKPFMVDARIELTTVPSKNRLCAPFLLSKSESKLTGGIQSVKLKRPYIERVISIIFNVSNTVNKNDGISSYIKNSIIDVINEIKTITNKNLVENSNSDKLSNSQELIKTKYYKIIKALTKELAENVSTIQKIRNQINWQPLIGSKGIESQISIKDVDSSDKNNLSIEKDIIKADNLKFLSQTDFDLGNSSSDVGDFVFSNIEDVVFGNFKNVSNFYDAQKTSLVNKRNELFVKANECLKNIEIFTGEFSGIGLLDILAIQTAIWSMSSAGLVGLLDDAAFDRMKLRNDIKYTGARSDITSALTEFEEKLSQVFNIIEKYYENYKNGTIQTS